VPAGSTVGNRDVRGPLAKNGPKYLRWALIEAATHAARDAHCRDRYERMKGRLGRQRGAKVARIDLARKLAEAIWHILTLDRSAVLIEHMHVEPPA
jgi:transposase